MARTPWLCPVELRFWMNRESTYSTKTPFLLAWWRIWPMTLWRPIFLDRSSLLMGRPAFTASSTGFRPSIMFSELGEGGLFRDDIGSFSSLLSAMCILRVWLQVLVFISQRAGIMDPSPPHFCLQPSGFLVSRRTFCR